MKTFRTICIAGLLLLTRQAWAATEGERIERLQMLADLWGKLYLFHPHVVTTDVDWNRVLLETIPRVEKAANTDELIAVLNELLFRPLDDPLLIAQKHEEHAPDPPRRELTARKLSTTVGYLDASDPRQYGDDPMGRVEALVKGLGAVQMLIVDLRFPGPMGGAFDWLRLFLDGQQATGASVSRQHNGWNEYNSPTDAYRQLWNVIPGSPVKPLENGRALRAPVDFVVNQTSYGRVADIIDSLQSTGRAAVILERRGRFPSGWTTERLR